jgi:solute carrier family 35 protein C2
MFSPEHLDFKFPLFTTCAHMLVQFSLATLVLYFLPQFRPRYDSISNPHNAHIADSDRVQHETDSKKPLMTKVFYFTRIGPCGMATGLDIGLGNMSWKFITLTFYSELPPKSQLGVISNLSLQPCANLPPSPSYSCLHFSFGLKVHPGVWLV